MGQFLSGPDLWVNMENCVGIRFQKESGYEANKSQKYLQNAFFFPQEFHFHGNIQLQKLNYTTQEHSD